MMYDKLLKMNGEKCYTLTARNEATMLVDDEGVTIEYESENSLFIPREMIEYAINLLIERGKLTKDDVHNDITNKNGPTTDRIMAVLIKLPGIAYYNKPRTMYFVDNN